MQPPCSESAGQDQPASGLCSHTQPAAALTSTPHETTNEVSRPPTATSKRQAPSHSAGPCTEANHIASRTHHTWRRRGAVGWAGAQGPPAGASQAGGTPAVCPGMPPLPPAHKVEGGKACRRQGHIVGADQPAAAKQHERRHRRLRWRRRRRRYAGAAPRPPPAAFLLAGLRARAVVAAPLSQLQGAGAAVCETGSSTELVAVPALISGERSRHAGGGDGSEESGAGCAHLPCQRGDTKPAAA